MMMQLSRKLSRMGEKYSLESDYGSNAFNGQKESFTTHYFKNNTEKSSESKDIMSSEIPIPQRNSSKSIPYILR